MVSLVSVVDHKKVPFGKLALAMRLMTSPKHITALLVVATGIGFTNTVAEVVSWQPRRL